MQSLDICLWERRPEDVDFLSLRLGTGKISSAMNIVQPDPDTDSEAIRRAFGLYIRYREIENAPIAISLRELGSMGLVGRRNDRIAAVYSFVSQLVALHSPEDLQIFLFSSKQYYRGWQWLSWLPHLSSTMTPGDPDFMAFSVKQSQELVSYLSKQLDSRGKKKTTEVDDDVPMTPFLVVILDGDNGVPEEPVLPLLLKEGMHLNVMAIILSDIIENIPSDCKSIIELKGRDKFMFWQTGALANELSGLPDMMNLLNVDNLAHRLIEVRAQVANLSGGIPVKINLLQTYRVRTIEELDIQKKWQTLPNSDGLLPFPAPIGNVREMEPLQLHLAENHDGPHGIVAGTTGSGKSELLQTLVSALAIEHHPYFLNFLLIDFKGGSAFGAFRNLPHTVGLISNLDRSSALRALEAIKAENLRRQRFLKEQNVEDILEYHESLAEKEYLPDNWEPLPHIFIIIDEFAQLAKDMPDFLPELMALLRVGRSLGLHLILATQRPAGAVNDEMRSNL